MAPINNVICELEDCRRSLGARLNKLTARAAKQGGTSAGFDEMIREIDLSLVALNLCICKIEGEKRKLKTYGGSPSSPPSQPQKQTQRPQELSDPWFGRFEERQSADRYMVDLRGRAQRWGEGQGSSRQYQQHQQREQEGCQIIYPPEGGPTATSGLEGQVAAAMGIPSTNPPPLPYAYGYPHTAPNPRCDEDVDTVEDEDGERGSWHLERVGHHSGMRGVLESRSSSRDRRGRRWRFLRRMLRRRGHE